MNWEKSSRREFISRTTLAATGLSLGFNSLSAKAYRRIPGANNRIGVGFIGLGNRGSELMHLFMSNPDCEVAALCDVYEPYVSRKPEEIDPRYIEMGKVPKMGEQFQNNPGRYSDYRKLLDDKNVDAVCISTPDHWHALQTIDSIKAGKDVYVEKPLTITLREGRRMVEAENSGNSIVAVGLNRRGSKVYQKLATEVQNGKIGKVTVARAAHTSNMFPNGIGKLTSEKAPENFDWNMWLGPRAYRDYQYNIAPYMFRWWSDYSSQMGNWGVHYMDVIRWLLGEKAPVAISAHGGKYVIDDDRSIPDTMQVIFEMPSGAIINFSIYEASSGGLVPHGEIELRGTDATLYAGEKGFKLMPTRPGQFQTWKELTTAEDFDANTEMLGDGSNRNSTATLIRNFLDCVKSREKPFCTLEEGHRSTSFAHLANIALATQTRLLWDAEKELFINHEKANALLHYEYRQPWKLS
ncbi:MAG: Gfo/Idh/MocA family oxidoreductase [Cyclobacteriaceae bacterium]|nr:Gfo/Idh/MocA family oxidoreductase [Cyclobacteriaceae bacterium]